MQELKQCVSASETPLELSDAAAATPAAAAAAAAATTAAADDGVEEEAEGAALQLKLDAVVARLLQVPLPLTTKP